jgi:lipoyl(octanoyl) transferase
VTTPRRTIEPHRPKDPLPVLDLGVAPYLPVQELQGRLRSAVAGGSLPGILLLLEHQPVITLGRRAGAGDLRDTDLIQALGIDVAVSERGGQATLHAPGQLVAYPIVPIPSRDLRSYVHDLEETLLVLLAGLGVAAHRRPGHPGLYSGEGKIASVGLRCHRWVCSHGTSLNVDLDLSLFDLIVSCGEPRLRQTSVCAETGRRYEIGAVKAAYLEAFSHIFSRTCLPPRRVGYQEAEAVLGLAAAAAEAPSET